MNFLSFEGFINYTTGCVICFRTSNYAYYCMFSHDIELLLDSDERCINKLYHHLKRFLEKYLYHAILPSFKTLIYPLCAVHKSMPFLPIEGVIVKILMSFF